MNAENIFMFANILFTIGTLLLFSKVFKNRNILNDFDVYGSILTMNALFCMLIGYAMLEMYLPFLFAIPTTLFWLYVSVHTLIQYNT
jgi:hypothetical protein